MAITKEQNDPETSCCELAIDIQRAGVRQRPPASAVLTSTFARSGGQSLRPHFKASRCLHAPAKLRASQRPELANLVSLAFIAKTNNEEENSQLLAAISIIILSEDQSKPLSDFGGKSVINQQSGKDQSSGKATACLPENQQRANWTGAGSTGPELDQTGPELDQLGRSWINWAGLGGDLWEMCSSLLVLLNCGLGSPHGASSP